MKVLILVVLILVSVYAGITFDKDLDHGHFQKYFENIKKTQRNGKITVHVVPHTHDDVGWLKTVDQYYTGERDDIQRAGVLYVINGIYDSLMKDPAKKFTYVEMAFFQKWWYEQSEEIQANVKVLVQEGRLQFVNAGMSMSDEATVHYEDFLNNMKAGHDFLKKELGYRPTIGWHIDPFGHHSATAALFAEMGFNAWFFARIDHQDKNRRLEEKEMEWLWRPFNKSLGARAEIFTHMMYQHYSSPKGFSFNEFDHDTPIVDDPRLENYNVDNRTEELHDYLSHMADHYKTNHLLVPFGDDFNYLNAQKMFYNIDKLIAHFNARYDDFELIYSTPYEYTEAVHSEDIEWPTKYDDLFPYSDENDAYWTGYFTSRANLKGYVREVSRDLNSQSMIFGIDNIATGANTFPKFEELFNQMGVLQHHDAVSGTEKQHVADDYAKNLYRSHQDAKAQFLESFERVFQPDLKNLGMCASHNSTFEDCPTKQLENGNVTEVGVAIMNTSNRRRTLGKIPLPNSNFTLHDQNYEEVHADIICEGNTNLNCVAYFEVDAEAWTLNLFYITKSEVSHNLRPELNLRSSEIGSLKLETKLKDKNIELLISKDGGKKLGVLMKYLYYESYQEDEGQDSGAYIFRPAQPDQQTKTYSGITTFDGFRGKYVVQNRFYGSQVTTTITANLFTDFVEIKSDLFGIPMSDQGKEVIFHLDFPIIQNNGIFYTDSMGLEMQERRVNYRPTWDLNVTQPISDNYYPINHGITIKDDKMTLEVLNDRPQGGSSLTEGSMEFMIQRRTYKDDSRGVGEAINETNPNSINGTGLGVITKHYLRFYNNVNHTIAQDSRWMQRELDSPLTYVYGSPSTHSKKASNKLFEVGFSLPDQVKLVFLPQEDGSIFARFENILDLISLDENANVNVTQVAYLFGLSMGAKVKSVTEVSNTGLFTMTEMKEMKYKWKGADFTTPNVDYSSDPENVELTPQRIRSFIFEYEKDSNFLISE